MDMVENFNNLSNVYSNEEINEFRGYIDGFMERMMGVCEQYYEETLNPNVVQNVVQYTMSPPIKLDESGDFFSDGFNGCNI